MYPRILWEQIADLLGSAEHTLGTTGPEDFIKEILSLNSKQLPCNVLSNTTT